MIPPSFIKFMPDIYIYIYVNVYHIYDIFYAIYIFHIFICMLIKEYTP